MIKKVGVINCGTNNISSIVNAFELIGCDPYIIKRGKEIKNFELIILPGVGAFPQAIENLKVNNLLEEIKNYSSKGKKILGICLGMQLLTQSSLEIKLTKGLNQVPGKVVKIENQKYNIGWRKINTIKNSLLGEFDNKYFYFQHQFKYNGKKKYIISTIKDSEKIPAIILKNNIIGVQFHPEKSQKNGLNFLDFIVKKF